MFFLLDAENVVLVLFTLVCIFFGSAVSMHMSQKRENALFYVLIACLSGALALFFAIARSFGTYEFASLFIRLFLFTIACLPPAFLFHAYALFGKDPSFLDRPPVLVVLALLSGSCALGSLLGIDMVRDISFHGDTLLFTFGAWAPLFFLYLIGVGFWAAAMIGMKQHGDIASLDGPLRIFLAIFFALCWFGALTIFFFLPFFGVSFSITPFVLGFLPLLGVQMILFFFSMRGTVLHLRTIIAELLIFALWALLLFRVFLADEPREQITNGLVLLCAVALGTLVIHLFHSERRSRESVEEVAGYLAEVNAKLRQLDKQKSEFVSIASHQLRSPLSVVVGYSSLLMEQSFGKIPATVRMPLERIFESARIMAIEIDDFLNITRLEQGNMKYQFAQCDLAGLAERLVKDFSFTASEKGLDLTCHRPEGEVMAWADEVKIRQVLVNLIDNAIRYTLKGYVSVRISYKDQNTVMIVVEDSGIGIPKIDQERLFNKFMRASNANTQSVHGTGLGLYLVREMILAHQGTIEIRSEEGEGTTCTITLPRQVGGPMKD